MQPQNVMMGVLTGYCILIFFIKTYTPHLQRKGFGAGRNPD